MKHFLSSIFLLGLFLGTQAQNDALIFANARIIDVEKARVSAPVFIQIKRGRIERITRNRAMLAQGTARFIDLKGKYVMPGLWDMHTHTWDRWAFDLLLANGVTGYRGMFEPMDSVRNWRKEAAHGKLLAPDMYVAGPIVDGAKPVWQGSVALKDVFKVEHVVDSLIRLGVDFIKVYSLLSPEVYRKLAEVCRDRGIPFAGHVPTAIRLEEAIQLGQASSEHLYGALAASNSRADHFFAVMSGEVYDSTLTSYPKVRAFHLKYFDAQRARNVMGKLAQSQTWICPTLTVNRSISKLNEPQHLADSRLKYIPPVLRAQWHPRNDFRFQRADEDYFSREKTLFQIEQNLVGQMEKAGVKLLAGTDYPNPYVFPGFSLHDELELMVAGGVSIPGALRSATLNPAIFMQRVHELGTVSVGKFADLLILEANPLEAIQNTRSVAGVVLRGKWLDKKTLDRSLQQLETRFRIPKGRN